MRKKAEEIMPLARASHIKAIKAGVKFAYGTDVGLPKEFAHGDNAKEFATLAATVVGMAYAPRTEMMFILWTSFYAITLGLSYAGFTAFTLEAIGKGAAATKYNIFASLSNSPIYLRHI